LRRATAAGGALFGIPLLRIKGFYLTVATLAAQFFLEWCFIRIPWFCNCKTSGAIEVPQRELFGVVMTGPPRQVGNSPRLPRHAHDVRLQERVQHAVDGCRHPECLAELDHLAAEPGKLQPIAAFEIERH